MNQRTFDPTSMGRERQVLLDFCLSDEVLVARYDQAIRKARGERAPKDARASLGQFFAGMRLCVVKSKARDQLMTRYGSGLDFYSHFGVAVIIRARNQVADFLPLSEIDALHESLGARRDDDPNVVGRTFHQAKRAQVFVRNRH